MSGCFKTPTIKTLYEKGFSYKELSGVFSSALAALGLWTDPTICMNTTKKRILECFHSRKNISDDCISNYS